MAKRSEQSKLRRDLKKSHMLEMLSAAYNKKTSKDPVDTMLVTQEVRDAGGRVVGVNYWYDLNVNQNLVGFMSNVTAGLYKAIKDDNLDAIGTGLKLIEDFYDRNDPKTVEPPTFDVSEPAP